RLSLSPGVHSLHSHALLLVLPLMSSLLSAMIHSVPLLTSSSLDDPSLPRAVYTSSTASSPSLSLHSTPLSPLSAASSVMEMNDAAPPSLDETHHVLSDPDEVFVEASESLPDQGDARVMFEGEETENQKMDLGLGDVNLHVVSAFQTPDRKRTFEVDSKTITRPKKTSPLSLPLPEVFNQENEQDTVSAPGKPVAQSTPVVMSSTTASSSSSISPRPTAAAAAGTPAPSAAAPPPAAFGETVTKRPAADRPAPSRAARQQTMVVSSALTKDLRAALEQEKASLDEAAATRLEARILALVQDKEREWAAKHEKLGQIMVQQKAEADEKARQYQVDQEGLLAALDAANAAMEKGFSCGPSSSSSLPHLPPAPVIAAMSADKLADLARLKKEIENLESENNKLHSQYNSLYETYSQQRTVIPTLKTANDELERGIRHERERFEKLKKHAEAKLEEASDENAKLRDEMRRALKSHDDDTLAIRMRLKQREGEVKDLEMSLQQKKRQVTELKAICDELISKTTDVNASDIE
ncbi:hypothetical protein PMAYCL1PPCAC_01977, partial [Pristionchus mayeri]